MRLVVACCRIRDSQGSRGPKVSVALEKGEKSEIRVIQARYYGVVSACETCHSIRSEACALLTRLSQPVIGVDCSSDSEVLRVTRGIGQGCPTRFVAFPVAFQISRFRSQNYCGKTTRSDWTAPLPGGAIASGAEKLVRVGEVVAGVLVRGGNDLSPGGIAKGESCNTG